MPKLIPREMIKKIRLLRQQGYSLPEIKKVVKVSHGSVFRYIQGIEILPEYKQVWHSKRGGSIKRMKIAEKKAEKMANKFIKRLSVKEKMIFLSALYWGEGSKSEFGLSNTDPDLIKIFVNGLESVFNIHRDRLRVSIRIFEDLDQKKSLSFWSKITGIPKEKFTSVNILRGKKKGKLQYGMCRIRMTKGGDVLKYIKALNKKITNIFTSSHSSTDRAQVS